MCYSAERAIYMTLPKSHRNALILVIPGLEYPLYGYIYTALQFSLLCKYGVDLSTKYEAAYIYMDVLG